MEEEQNELMMFELMSGKTIVGMAQHVVIDEDCEIVLKNCIQLESVPTQEGMRVMVLPYGNFAENAKITLQKQAIVWTGYPAEQIRNEYNRAFSQIILPTTGGANIVDVSGTPIS